MLPTSSAVGPGCFIRTSRAYVASYHAIRISYQSSSSFSSETPFEKATHFLYRRSYVSSINLIKLKGSGKRGHIAAGALLPTQMFPPFARARNICCGHKFCVRDTKNVSNFVQKHFVSATKVSQFARARNIMSNNVSATMCPRLPVP